jgi:polysaccharide deacetylase 2 family uncharacterized protein YibQ
VVLEAKAVGSKKEFLKETIREARVRGKEIILTYRLPLAPVSMSDNSEGGKFFTVLQMVVAAGLEPATSRM